MNSLIVCLFCFLHPALEIGVPSDDTQIENPNYVVGFSTKEKSAIWSAERLTTVPQKPGRDGEFVSDHRVPKAFRVTGQDYLNSGYDKGHLSPAADFAENKDTFLFTNCCPQNPNLNRGVWEHIEVTTRKHVTDGNTIYVFTGPLWAPEDPEHQDTESQKAVVVTYLGGSHIPIPTHFYKCVYVKSPGGGFKAVGYLCPNRKPTKFTAEDFIVPIDLIEHWSGCDFGSGIDENLQKVIER